MVHRGVSALKELMHTALVGSFLFGAVLAIGTILGIRPIMLSLNCDPLVVTAVQSYVCLRALSTPMFVLSNIIEGCFVGLRDTITPLKVGPLNPTP